MDTIQFVVIPASSEASSSGATRRRRLLILINDRDLIDMVREAESPLATSEGYPGIAGAYSGLPASLLRSEHLYGFPESRYTLLEGSTDEPGRTAVLLCQCGEPGCWPLIATITATEYDVTWDMFRQPHRPQWSYDQLGPFTFARDAYDAAVRVAASAG